MASIYVSTDTTKKVCPHCGSELVPAEYLYASKGDSHLVDVHTDWARGKTTKTISTQYTDIQRRWGAYCIACLYKKKSRTLIISRSMVMVGLLGALCFIGLMIVKNDTLYWLPALAFIAILIIGWKTVGDDGVVTENPYSGLTKEQIHARATTQNDSVFLDMNSFEYVTNFPKNQIPSGKTILSRNAFRK